MKIRKKGNRWEVEVYAGRDPLTGKELRPTRRTEPHATREEAEELWFELRREVRAGLHDRPGRASTFEQLAREWLATAPALEDWSPSTVVRDTEIVKRDLLPAFGPKKVARITTTDLDRFYAELLRRGGMKSQGLSAATVKRTAGVMTRALEQAVTWGVIGVNPARAAKRIRTRSKKEKVIPPTSALEQLLEVRVAADPDLAMYVRTVAATGSRKGEVLASRLSHVTLYEEPLVVDGHVLAGEMLIDRNIVIGPNGVVDKDTKTHAGRLVLLEPGTVEDLRLHRLRMAERALGCGVPLPDDAYLFCARQRGFSFHKPWRPDNVSHRFAAVREKAEVAKVPGLTIQNLRHYVGSHLVDRGIPMPVVSRQLGHARQSTTSDFYVKAVDARDPRVAGVMAELLPQKRRRSS